jgi:hypothetical protein
LKRRYSTGEIETWNKGKKCPNITYTNIKAWENDPERKLKHSENNTGENNWIAKLSPEEYEEECKRRSERMKCNKYAEFKKSKEHCKKISESRKGQKPNKETRKKLSKINKGENNNNVNITRVGARCIKILKKYTNLSNKEIANVIPNANPNIVSKIICGRSWSEVEI